MGKGRVRSSEIHGQKMNLQNFAKQLREFRKSAQITQMEVADRLRITPQTVSKWERGLSTPDLDNLIDLARLFDVSLDRLVLADDSSEHIFAAIDGGGTKTEFILFNEEGHILRRVLCGSTNPNTVGIDSARETMIRGLDELLYGKRPSGVFGGIAGSMTGNNGELLRSAIASRVSGVPIRIGSDIINVIHSVRGVNRCIAVICGTGSSVFGWDGVSLHRYGGWGYLFDGAGSGFDIGCDILRECFALSDGFGHRSLVTDLTQKQLGCPAIERLEEFYSGGRSKIASLVPIAFDAYRQGDETAHTIIERNLSRIATLIKAADNGSATVILSGGLTAHRDVIEPMLASMLPQGKKLVFPELPQIYGAALASMAFSGYDTAVPEVFDRNFTEDYDRLREET